MTATRRLHGPAAICRPRAEAPGSETASAAPATAAASAGPSTMAAETPSTTRCTCKLGANGPTNVDEGEGRQKDDEPDECRRQRRPGGHRPQPPQVASRDGLRERRTHL